MTMAFEPRIIGFLCDWCSRSIAETAGQARSALPPSVRVVGVNCTGRVDPLLLITAYLHGADGVLVVGCQPGQCHYKEGNYHARRRVALLKTIFETLDLDAGRLHIEWASDAEPGSIVDIATAFETQVEGQGPNAARSQMFC